MSPIVPYAIAGSVSIAGGFARHGGWTEQETRAVIATGALVLVAAFLAETPVAPIVTALGWLLAMAAVFVTTGLYKRS